MSIWSTIAALFARPPAAPAAPSIPGPDAGQDVDWGEVLRAAGFANPATWAELIAGPATRFEIRGRLRAAAFAATIAHESAGGARLVESLNYSAEGLRATWPSRFTAGDAQRMGRVGTQPANQRAIAERVYGGRMGNGSEGSGDGWRYRGRGLIQLTGRDAYRQAGMALGRPLEDRPELAEEPAIAAEIAAWAWSAWKRCNPLADAENVAGWRRAINAGLNGLEDVRARYQAVLRVV